MMTREQAWEHLCSWTKTESLRKHARAVEIVMRQAAQTYGNGANDVETWGIAGMLHDADYEQWPEDHPHRTVAWLRERGEEAIAHAVSAHYTKWNVPYESALDKALLACDELTGFIIAACLVRPDGVTTLTPKSVRNKLKDKAFAAKVERDEIQKGAELLGVDLSAHIQFIIEALKPHAEELGIGPKALWPDIRRGAHLLEAIGHLESAAQVQLLQVLRERVCQRVGGRTTRRVDIRLVAITHQDLAPLVTVGALRADLHLRLSMLLLQGLGKTA